MSGSLKESKKARQQIQRKRPKENKESEEIYTHPGVKAFVVRDVTLNHLLKSSYTEVAKNSDSGV